MVRRVYCQLQISLSQSNPFLFCAGWRFLAVRYPYSQPYISMDIIRFNQPWTKNIQKNQCILNMYIFKSYSLNNTIIYIALTLYQVFKVIQRLNLKYIGKCAQVTLCKKEMVPNAWERKLLEPTHHGYQAITILHYFK